MFAFSESSGSTVFAFSESSGSTVFAFSSLNSQHNIVLTECFLLFFVFLRGSLNFMMLSSVYGK